MREQLELTVTGAIADSVTVLIKGRFDHVNTQSAPGRTTVLTIAGIDQARANVPC